ncbi:Myb domain protein 67 [Hibiscus syriacus]|uniref:Myb domain protein 67 n=1 Tax=Hibiscus syriacus TaxID=106335 RepID=A0A6A2Y010_HIBSY|nr:Myb domain protein 67 [Hibiscus syriacus]
MPQELPGLYYDDEKNRYFPIKPRIPGSSSVPPSQNKPLSSSVQATKLFPQTSAPTSRLLHLRELNGGCFCYDRGRHSFQEEFHKLHASKPVVWRYGGTDTNLTGVNIRFSALEHTQIDVQTLDGQMETEVLLAGSIDGSLSLLKVGSQHHFDYGITYIPNHVWPFTKGEAENGKTPPYVWRPAAAPLRTNAGAALVDVERGTSKWVCRSKSDVFALQFDQTGNIVLCGLRNGAIVTLDVRENQERIVSRLTKLQTPYSSSGRSNRRKWFEIRGLVSPSHTIYMPSSISSLVSLQSYDQYFLASSMDGWMKLYDHRLTKRGAVQSYGGHVNSHSRIQLAVDQYERFVMSGGEDCYLRLWSIKSGSVDHNCGAWLGSEEGLFHMKWP